MATNIKTLKEDNGDITYPQTVAGAVYTSQGSDAQTVLDSCVRAEEIAATSTLSPLVTSSMIDWSTVRPTVSTESTTATEWFAPGWYKRIYPDGRIIYTCYTRSIQLTFNAGLSWGSGANKIKLPVVFDSSKMSATGSVGVLDPAISMDMRFANGDQYVHFPWVNHYSSTVTTYIDANVRLEVFPN